MIVSASVIKSWFETGDTPTQEQYENLIDSLRHKLEKITLTDLDLNLSNALNAGTRVFTLGPTTVNSWIFPAGTLIEKIVVIDSAAVELSLGTTDMGEQIMQRISFLPNDSSNRPVTIDYYCTVDTTIHFNGMNPTTIIKIYKS